MQLFLNLAAGTASALPVGLGSVAKILGAVVASIAILPHLPQEFWVLAALAVVADARPLPALVANRQLPTVFLSVCFTFAIMLLWGPVPAILVQTVSLVVAALRLKFRPWWLVFTVLRLAIAFLVADAVLDLFGSPPFVITPWVNRMGVFAVLAAAGVWFAVSYLILIVGLAVRYRVTWVAALRRTFGYELVATGALLLLAPVFVDAPTGWAILFVLVPVFAVSQLARLSAERERELRHDPLTGLLGRRGLTAEIDAEVAADRGRPESRPRRQFALLLLDLDRFKAVNDTLGHAVGDRLLVEVAKRLKDTVRPEDKVARLGGDEFAVLAPGVDSVAAAQAIAGRIGDALATPASLDGLLLDVSASIGVSLYPDHGRDVAALLRQADVAMYEAKRAGETVAVYSPRSDSNSPERLGLLADLRDALRQPERRGEINFYYQPQVAIATGEVVGLEALLRWRHPVRGLVAPEEVVRVAEHTDAMLLLTMRAVDEVVGQIAEWNDARMPLRVSINVSVRDLHTTAFVDHLAARLRDCGVAPGQVGVEITETAFMADSRLVLRTVNPLADLGVGLALDDLGTGYSSLQHLRQLPLTEVKVDRSFVQSMTTSPDDETIVRSVVELAHALGLRVVAEGVSDGTIHQMLAEIGCDIGQGWHYARAMPADQVKPWLSSHVAGPPVSHHLSAS